MDFMHGDDSRGRVGDYYGGYYDNLTVTSERGTPPQQYTYMNATSSQWSAEVNKYQWILVRRGPLRQSPLGTHRMVNYRPECGSE